MFVETVLRYGLPLDYVAASIKVSPSIPASYGSRA
jgi:hypothetical protein